MKCEVTHAPGRHYVCWTHREFIPWEAPFNRTPGECACLEVRNE